MPSLVQEIPHHLEMAKTMSQRVSLSFPVSLVSARPSSSCGALPSLRGLVEAVGGSSSYAGGSELLPGLKEATSKDAATTTDKWNQKALPQPRHS